MVRHGGANLFERRLVHRHPHRHENGADPLLGRPRLHFEIGDNLLDEVHEGLQ
jgi:hypothetical protein